MGIFNSANIRAGGYIETLANIEALRNYPLGKVDDGDAIIVAHGDADEDKLGGIFVWHKDSVSLEDDDFSIIAPVSVVKNGRWVRVGTNNAADIADAVNLIDFKMPVPGSVRRSLGQKLSELEFSPEDFGAVGDGVADDTAAIQAALDAISARKILGKDTAGTLRLTSGKRYKCTSTITMDRAYHNLVGNAILDFSSVDGIYLRVKGALTEFGNGYGQNGSIDGQIIILGSRITQIIDGVSVTRPGGIGVQFDSEIPFSSTHIRTIGLTVVGCSVGFQFRSRSYNQDFINCKAFGCDVIFDWLAEADDGDERINVFGGTFYNSETFLRSNRTAGCFYMFGGSIDYTAKVCVINGSRAQFFGTHFESNRWTEAPFILRQGGALGAYVLIQGGWMLSQANLGGFTHMVDVGEGCSMKIRDINTNNIGNAAVVPNAFTPPTWATGSGRFEITGTEIAFEFASSPQRMQEDISVLADGNFDAPALGQDMIWRVSDINAIQDRYGAVKPAGAGAENNITLVRATTGQLNGTGCLRINKAYGFTSEGQVGLIAIPVRFGDKAIAGFRIKVAGDRPGTSTDSRRVIADSGYIKLDGYTQYNVPIITKFTGISSATINPTPDNWMVYATSILRSQCAVPTWATHFYIQLNFTLASEVSFLIDGMWADRF